MNISKILIIGGSGQLGYQLKLKLKKDFKVYTPNRIEIDLTKTDMLIKKIKSIKPHLIINAAAYTDVEKAEKEPELVNIINVLAPRVISRQAMLLDIPLIHISTDYVFDGKKKKPYKEKDSPNPLNQYGFSKLMGEYEIQKSKCKYIILRTSWIYDKQRGNNFYRKMIKLFRTKIQINVVSDQYGAPTSSNFLAKKIKRLIKNLVIIEKEKFKFGIYHLAEQNFMSWYDFSLKIFNENKSKYKFIIKKIRPIKSVNYRSLATRPRYSCLDCSLINEIYEL